MLRREPGVHYIGRGPPTHTANGNARPGAQPGNPVLMLRRTLLSLSQNASLRRWMEQSRLSRSLTSRFVAGSTLADGIRVLIELSREQTLGTLDFLGENVTSLDEAAQSRDSYLKALDEIQRAQLPATVSIKLTQFGLDFSYQA